MVIINISPSMVEITAMVEVVVKAAVGAMAVQGDPVVAVLQGVKAADAKVVMVEGKVVLAGVKAEGFPILTDIHEAGQAEAAAEVADILQIPAFLCRQTDLLLACGKTGRTVNVKKGQFMAPVEMGLAIEKIKSTGNTNVMLTERGTFFGYGRLVNDFTGLAVMAKFGQPVVFDVTHSTQMPAALGNTSGGNPEYSPLLARAAVASGVVDGLFLECHPDPRNAKSDAATMMGLGEVGPLLKACAHKRIC